MTSKLFSEIKSLAEQYKLNISCSNQEDFIREFQDKVNWLRTSCNPKLSEDFIRKFQDKVDWEMISRKQKLSEDFIREFQNNFDWDEISFNQKLSENFIREFQDRVDWREISCCQKLSENFIREFQDRVNWKGISYNQKLSENFIREFRYKVNWYVISYCQKLSESFIREFQDKINWQKISHCQELSRKFIKEFSHKLDIAPQLKKHHRKVDKEVEISSYASKHNLRYEDGVLYAYRNHDQDGHGVYNKTITYIPGKYYRDWRCDLEATEQDSFGLGIYLESNFSCALTSVEENFFFKQKTAYEILA